MRAFASFGPPRESPFRGWIHRCLCTTRGCAALAPKHALLLDQQGPYRLRTPPPAHALRRGPPRLLDHRGLRGFGAGSSAAFVPPGAALLWHQSLCCFWTKSAPPLSDPPPPPMLWGGGLSCLHINGGPSASGRGPPLLLDHRRLRGFGAGVSAAFRAPLSLGQQPPPLADQWGPLRFRARACAALDHRGLCRFWAGPSAGMTPPPPAPQYFGPWGAPPLSPPGLLPLLGWGRRCFGARAFDSFRPPGPLLPWG